MLLQMQQQAIKEVPLQRSSVVGLMNQQLLLLALLVIV
jgi:hypothetical protein